MNKQLNKQQLQNLEKWLADFNKELIAQGIEKDNTIHWETLESDPKDRRNSFYIEDFTLYNGNGGIVLYLLSMYSYSQEEIYLKLAKKGTQWLLHQLDNHENNHFDLYTGKTGVCYALSELYDATAEPYYLDTALEVILKNKERFRNHFSDDLLSGNAGNMFVLAKLFIQSNHTEIEALLLECLDDLIDNSYLSKQGLKWRYRPNYIDSLCGLSHGTAGIGFALIEIGRALQAPSLIWLGEQAFEYEDQHYIPENFSWPDFRIHPEKLEHPETVPETEILMKGEQVDGWAHGSVGVTLTRLRAFLHTGDVDYRKKTITIADHLIKSTAETINYSLTNGHGANAYFLASVGYYLNSSTYTNTAYYIIQQAIQLKTKQGYLPSGWDFRKPDLSVFMGETGLALCILRLLHPEAMGDVVLPALPANTIANSSSFPDQKNMLNSLFTKYYPQTAKHITQIPKKRKELSIYHFFAQLNEKTDFSEDSYFDEERFGIEKSKMELEVQMPDFIFMSERYQRIQQSIAPFDPLKKFVINAFTTMIESATASHLLVKFCYGVEEYTLSGFTLMLLKELNKPTSIDELYTFFVSQFSEEIHEREIKVLITEQLKQFYTNGIVRQVD